MQNRVYENGTVSVRVSQRELRAANPLLWARLAADIDGLLQLAAARAYACRQCRVVIYNVRSMCAIEFIWVYTLLYNYRYFILFLE